MNDLHLNLTEATGRSLESALREAIRSGRLAAGTRLPGTRSLAADLGLARGTVVQVYSQLVAEGWLLGESGSGTRVAAVLLDEPQPPQTSPQQQLPLNLVGGRPDLSSFPRTAWAASVRRVLANAPNETFDYPDPAGLPVLRTAVADYVSRARGVRATPDSVVITAGFSHGLALLARVFRTFGRISMENPGLKRHRGLVEAAGLKVHPLSIDASGADPADLDGRVAVLTPAHQHPLGMVLAPERRTRFVEWAREVDGFVVEDDYDGEFRYDQQPVGAMQALAPDRVIYAGSASKSLAPGVRLGWLVVPPVLRESLLQAIVETAAGIPAIDQLVMADLIARGDYDRHIRKVRLVYRRRRAELAARLAEVWPTPLEGIAAGLHAVLPLESAAEERRLVDLAAYSGLTVHGLQTFGYWHTENENQPSALVLGYATPSAHTWRRTLDVLIEVLQATKPSRQDG